MTDAHGDTVVILSSELIAEITEQYFNKVMFKQRVKIVDLKAQGDNGYAFNIRFLRVEKPALQQATPAPQEAPVDHRDDARSHRDGKGRFTATSVTVQ